MVERAVSSTRMSLSLLEVHTRLRNFAAGLSGWEGRAVVAVCLAHHVWLGCV